METHAKVLGHGAQSIAFRALRESHLGRLRVGFREAQPQSHAHAPFRRRHFHVDLPDPGYESPPIGIDPHSFRSSSLITQPIVVSVGP